MGTNRRKWLKQIGLVAAGIGFARLQTFGAPMPKAGNFPTDTVSDGPIRLSSNENPYGPSQMARDAMANTVSISNRYQWQMIKDLVAAIAEKNNLTKENVMIGAGSIHMLNIIMQYAALQKGNVVVADPTFSSWTEAAEKLGLQKIMVPLKKDKKNDLTAMLAAIKPDTRMVYVCNPNNPTGTVCSHDSLVSFINEATKHTLVLVDEAYLDYTNERSVSSLVTVNTNLIVVKTFSKIYGLAGARIGYGLAHATTIDKLGQIQFGANIGVSAVSLAGALASLKDDAFVKETFSQNQKIRSLTIEQMERLNIHCIASSTNFIYFSLADYKKDFFEQLKAYNIEGTEIFEEDGKWSRITVGSMGEMKKFVEAIK